MSDICPCCGHSKDCTFAIKMNALAYYIIQLQAELAKHRWIPADNPPENIDWEEYYLVLEESGTKPMVMQAQQIWLDEGSEIAWYMPIPDLPKG